MGRPSTFSDELFDQICERMGNGETLIQICRDDQMPDRGTVVRWVANDNSRRRRYEAARRACVEYWSDQIIEIACDGSKDTIRDKKGRPRCDWEWLGRSKLRVETMFKLMGKINPERFGDKLPEAVRAREIEAAEQQAAYQPVQRIERVIVSAPGDIKQDENGEWVSDPNGREKLHARIRELEAQLAGKDTAAPKPPALLTHDPGLPKRADQEIAGRMIRLIRDTVPVDGSRDPASVLDEMLHVCRDAIRTHFGPTGEIIPATA